jgi:hypothetical protein
MTTKKLEPRTFFDPATGYAFEVYVEEGAPPLPGQWADPNPPPLVQTLSGARVEFAAARASGRKRVVCPCCDKPANFYKRKLNSGMVDVLIRIYRAAGGSPGEIVSIEQIFGSRKQDHRDWPLLRHWGLVQPASRRDSHKNAQGLWRITPLGIAFVEDKIAVAKYIVFIDGEPTEREGETTVREALGNAFSYPELMGFET